LISKTEKKAETSDYTARDLLAKVRLAEVYANNSEQNDVEENTKPTEKQNETLSLIKTDDEAYFVHNTFGNEEFTAGLTALAQEENGLCML